MHTLQTIFLLHHNQFLDVIQTLLKSSYESLKRTNKNDLITNLIELLSEAQSADFMQSYINNAAILLQRPV